MLSLAGMEENMFRPLTGFRTTYQGLTIVVASEFDEWRVILHSPEVVIQGQRQYSAAKAKEHALMLAKSYLEECGRLPESPPPEPEWQPTGPRDWLVWKA